MRSQVQILSPRPAEKAWCAQTHTCYFGLISLWSLSAAAAEPGREAAFHDLGIPCPHAPPYGRYAFVRAAPGSRSARQEWARFPAKYLMRLK